MAIVVRLVWPGLRLMMLPFVWLAWFPAVAIMLAGTGLIMCTVTDSDGRIINLVCAFGCCSVAARIFNTRRYIIRRR
jgi:hypothetical protein